MSGVFKPGHVYYLSDIAVIVTITYLRDADRSDVLGLKARDFAYEVWGCWYWDGTNIRLLRSKHMLAQLTVWEDATNSDNPHYASIPAEMHMLAATIRATEAA